MTTFSALLAVQTAVIKRLREDAVLSGMVSGVFDAVPEGQAFPYVVYVDAFEIPDRTLGQGGFEVHFTLLAHTRDGSDTTGRIGYAGYRQLALITARAVELLTDYDAENRMTVTGWDVVDSDVERLDLSRDDDGITRRGEIDIIMKLEDNPNAP
jgi:hypothetical protein